LSTGLKANVDGSAAIQVGGVDAITLTSAGAASFVTSPMTIQGGSAAAPSLTFSGDTNTGIFSPAADTIAFSEGGVESMRIDASGNVGIGTSSPASTLNVANANGGSVAGANPSNEAVRITQSPTVGSGGYVLQRLFLNKSSTANDGAALSFEGLAVGGDRYALGNIGGYVDNAGSGNSVSGYLAFLTKPTNASITERVRIDSSGNLLVGATNVSIVGTGTGFAFSPNFQSVSGNGTLYVGNSATTNAQAGINLYSTGASAYRFYVGMAGTVFATSTTISAISDQRLKENIQDLDVGIDAVMALKPRKFDWKEGKGVDIKNARGFIAQEFEEVFPDLIDTWKDEAPEGEEPYKSVRADLIPVLVKALQELKAELDATKAEVALLKGAA
jgi:hypothetical protein